MLTIVIEIGRGFAALWVFAFHLSGMIGGAVPALQGLARAGHFGVPVFFVISGYCMMAVAQATIAKSESARGFLAWRFLRIFPPYWFSILALLAIPYVLEGFTLAKSGAFVWPTAPWQAFSALDWVKYVTLTQAFASRGTGLENAFSALNVVYWTLAIEFQFYLVMFAALCVRRHFNAVIIAVTLISVPVALLPAAYNTGLFVPYWPMFALGLALHRSLSSGYGPERALGTGAFATSAVMTIIIVADLVFVCSGSGRAFHDAHAHLSNLVQSSVVALCFWMAVPLDLRLRSMLHAQGALALLVRPLVVLGTISYSLYLLHGKLYQIPFAVVRQVLPGTHPLSLLLTILGTIGLAWLFCIAFEKPFLRRNLTRRFARRTTLASAAVH